MSGENCPVNCVDGKATFDTYDTEIQSGKRPVGDHSCHYCNAPPTDLTSGHDADKDGRKDNCDRGLRGYDCLYGVRCPGCPEPR